MKEQNLIEGSDQDATKDIAFTCTSDVPPPIPDGEGYEVVFTHGDMQTYQRGRKKLYLWYQLITPGQWEGREFFMVCNMPCKRTLGAFS
jgi:hypothetical protein